jgi:hypothetical protein
VSCDRNLMFDHKSRSRRDKQKESNVAQAAIITAPSDRRSFHEAHFPAAYPKVTNGESRHNRAAHSPEPVSGDEQDADGIRSILHDMLAGTNEKV